MMCSGKIFCDIYRDKNIVEKIVKNQIGGKILNETK